MTLQLEMKEDNFKQSLLKVKEELKEGKDFEIKQAQIEFIELKEHQEELKWEKQNISL